MKGEEMQAHTQITMHSPTWSTAAPKWPRLSLVRPQDNPTASAVSHLPRGWGGLHNRLGWGALSEGRAQDHRARLAWNHLAHSTSRKVSFPTNKITFPTPPEGFAELCRKRSVRNLNSRTGFGQLGAGLWRAAKDTRITCNHCAGRLTLSQEGPGAAGTIPPPTGASVSPSTKRETHSFTHPQPSDYLMC